MVGRQTLGLLGFAGAAVGGAALAWLAERRVAGPPTLPGDAEWAELRQPVPGRPTRVASFDGTCLHAEVSGPEGAPTLVLVHGYGLSLRAWHYQRRDLSGDFRVVAYDQRGHGGSQAASGGDYSIGALGRDLAAILDALAPATEPVVAVGHSLGGMTLLSWAEQHPRLVPRRLAGAALVNTTGSDVLAGGLATTSAAVLQVLQRRVFDGLLGGAFGGVLGAPGRGPRGAEHAAHAPTDLSHLLSRALGFGSSASPAQVVFVEQLLLDCPNGVKAALGPTLTGLDLRAAAPLLTVPALVLVGEQDRLTPPAAARRLAAALPDARLVQVAGAGHNTMLEAHDAVTAHLRHFARAVLGRAA